MAECTEKERALLDAVASGKGIGEARDALILASIPDELRELTISAHAACARANAMREKAWNALNALGVSYGTMGHSAFDAFYSEMERLGAARADK